MSDSQNNETLQLFANRVTTLNNQYVKYTQKDVADIIDEQHAMMPGFFSESQNIGLDCVKETSTLGTKFLPVYQGAAITSHGFAVKFDKNNLPTHLITPIGSYIINNDCDIKSNKTQGYLADQLAASLKKDLEMYSCTESESEKVFAIGTAYERMLPKMLEVGFDNIKCTSGVFAPQQHYKDLVDNLNQLKINNTKLEKSLNETTTNLTYLLNLTNATANLELKENYSLLKSSYNKISEKYESARQAYSSYKDPISSGLKNVVVDLAGTLGIALYLRSKGVESTTPRTGDWVLSANVYKNIIVSATVGKEMLHVALAKGSQNIPYFDEAFNIAAVVGIAVGATYLGITVSPTILLTAGITVVAINYLGASDYKSYEAPILSAETAGEFAFNVGIKLGTNHLLSKYLPNVSPKIDTTHTKDMIPACDKAISEVVRSAKVSNVEAVTINSNFPVSKFIQESTGNPGAKGIVMSVTSKGSAIIKDEAPGLISSIGNKIFAGLKAVYETIGDSTASASENGYSENHNSSTKESTAEVSNSSFSAEVSNSSFSAEVSNSSFSEANTTLAGKIDDNHAQEHSNDL